MSDDLPAPTVHPGSPFDDTSASRTSSSSSFVPIDCVEDAIQVIDESKTFNQELWSYLKSSRAGSGDYRIISVFGSQSTGKSTLLNHLFNTNFDVMKEGNRQQTTKGIWLAHSPGVTHVGSQAHDNILVMDVEGTDGRERGEDQDFERKAALFALATSEVLIVNLWETQVGLYQGANMGLLKTVFEVNLLLFGAAKLHHNDHKVLLLFVIRDHLGVTPKESLAATITQDLLRMWDGLNKPLDVSHLRFDDFFDLAFHTLSHKVLQAERFLDDVRELGTRFVDTSDSGYLFKPYYHHDVPLDGWTMYAENCWTQIDSNKDLDLPTQQILVAKFKCDEIANQCFEEFLEHYLVLEKAASEATPDVDYKEVGRSFSDVLGDALENYELLASKYNQAVYEQKHSALDDKIKRKLLDVFAIYAKQLLAQSIKTFTAGLSKKPRAGTFLETVEKMRTSTHDDFSTTLLYITVPGDSSASSSYVATLTETIDQVVAKQQTVELNALVSKLLKRLNNGMSTVLVDELAAPSDQTWEHVLAKFKELSTGVLDKYLVDGEYNFSLGTEGALNTAAVHTFKFKAWVLLDDLIHKHIGKDALLGILKDRFDDKFRYDDNGLPKLYQNTHELEGSFADAKAYALKVFSFLTFAKLANGSELRPEYDIHNKALRKKHETVSVHEDEPYGADDSDDEDAHVCFAEIISEKDKAQVLSKFKRETDAKFVETKRAIMQLVTQIPYYIYLIIVVLGWNEFMAIVRNPIFFTLLIIVGAGGYVMYLLNLLGPAYIVLQRMVDEAIVVGKQKLRQFVIDDHETHGRNLGKMAATEEIELDDLGLQEE